LLVTAIPKPAKIETNPKRRILPAGEMSGLSTLSNAPTFKTAPHDRQNLYEVVAGYVHASLKRAFRQK